jgi:hypothetical protein
VHPCHCSGISSGVLAWVRQLWINELTDARLGRPTAANTLQLLNDLAVVSAQRLHAACVDAILVQLPLSVDQVARLADDCGVGAETALRAQFFGTPPPSALTFNTSSAVLARANEQALRAALVNAGQAATAAVDVYLVGWSVSLCVCRATQLDTTDCVGCVLLQASCEQALHRSDLNAPAVALVAHVSKAVETALMSQVWIAATVSRSM